ncbi:MAG: hypothetical protein EBU09_00350 [Betaproteobacteria bacterium]|nr:hypothetical protein [Betaproteobacteria bacterium]
MRLPGQVYRKLGFTHEEFEKAMVLVQQLGSNQAADQAMSLEPGTVAKWAKEWIKAQRETVQTQMPDAEALSPFELESGSEPSRPSRNAYRYSKRSGARSGSAAASVSRADESELDDAEAALQAFRREPSQADKEAPQQRQMALARLEEVAEGLRKLSEVSERAALTQSKASADEEIKAMLKLATTMMEFMRKQQDSSQEQIQTVQGRLERIEAFQQQIASRSDPSAALMTQLEALSKTLDTLSTEEQIIQVQDDVADVRDLIDETLRLAPRLQDIARELFRKELHDHSRLLGEQLSALMRQHADAMIESDARMPGAIIELLDNAWGPSFEALRQSLEQSTKLQTASLSGLRHEIEKKDQELRQSIERKDQSQLVAVVGGINKLSGQIDGVRHLVDEFGTLSAQAEQIHSLHQEIARLQRVVEQLQAKSALRITL